MHQGSKLRNLGTGRSADFSRRLTLLLPCLKIAFVRDLLKGGLYVSLCTCIMGLRLKPACVQLFFLISSRDLIRIRITTECPLNCATSGMEFFMSQVRRKTYFRWLCVNIYLEESKSVALCYCLLRRK